MKQPKECTPCIIDWGLWQRLQPVRPIVTEYTYTQPVNDYSPYCSRCGSCGEEGCCSALSCAGSGGDYCESYLRDLRFGYAMYRQLMSLLENDPVWAEQVDRLWDENYDRFYRDK